ncbi:TPA: hypothetical protein RTB45_001804 [Campylobacter jejuni]|nr:hypothetical protein [Campylobacter jejuni]HEG0426710.1 hypothetical protein [Campylobacter jejuni]HEH3967702.1 hypothetical protein [Campylobacter jejuni]
MKKVLTSVNNNIFCKNLIWFKNINPILEKFMPTEQTDLEYLFFKERLESYNNIYEHFENLKMIASITTKIAILELVLRNLLDKHMKEKDLEWLRNYNEENIKQKNN